MNEDIYITKFKRTLAFSIDFLVIVIVSGLLGSIIKQSQSSWVSITIVLITLAFYFVFLGNHYGFTLGQKLFKLKVVNAKTGSIPTKKQLVLRELLSLPVVTFIGYVVGSISYAYSSGYYWDRWSGVVVIPSRLTLKEFDRLLEEQRKILFPDEEK